MAKPPDRRDLEAGDAVRMALRSSLQRLVRYEAAVLRGRSAEAVHQARVALRRLRSDLKSFGMLVDRAWADALRQELAWLGDELGAVRDLDVMIDRLTGDAKRSKRVARMGPRARNVLARIRSERSAARSVLRSGLASKRYRTLRSRLRDAVASPKLTLAAKMPARKAMRAVVKDRWKKLRDAVAALPPVPAVRSLHRVRILAKRCRYAAEAAAIAAGAAAQSFADAAAKLQEALGEVTDAESARVRLRRMCRDHEVSSAAAALLASETQALQRAREDWRRAWDELDRKELRAWL